MGLIASGGLASKTAFAQDVSYVADTLESNPSDVQRMGRLYVRSSASRYEYFHMGMPVAEIELPGQGVRRMLFPVTRTYTEFSRPQTNTAPCVTTDHQICRKTGTEYMGGLETEVRELEMAGATEPIQLWWAPKRSMIVREDYPSNRRMHALRREAEPYEDHAAEQWELTYLLPRGRYLGGMAILAPELSAPVVERRPDRMIRRLVNINMQDTAAALFEIPSGFAPQRSSLSATAGPDGSVRLSADAGRTAGAQDHMRHKLRPFPQLNEGDTARAV
jgi:hypothetical protein